eukprot:s4448_g5.t1
MLLGACIPASSHAGAGGPLLAAGRLICAVALVGPEKKCPSRRPELHHHVFQAVHGLCALKQVSEAALCSSLHVYRGNKPVCVGCLRGSPIFYHGSWIDPFRVLINSSDRRDAKFRESLENEVNIMKALKHPHIVEYLGHDYLDECLYLYLEHVPGGSITQALNDFGAFSESLMASYARQTLEGLEYLHTREPAVIHRDIKGSNILIGDGDTVKLADFGCSKRTDETLTHTMRGSIPWMAPEVLAHSRYGRAADLWSFGCVVIEMGTANVPWGRFEHQMAALVKIGLSQETPPLPEQVSGECKDFLNQCIRRDPAERLNATEMLQHIWLNTLFDYWDDT